MCIRDSPKTDLVKDVLELNPQGYIITDEKMATNIEGVFAAGDVRDKYLRQVVTAVADGSIAAVAAQRYIQDRELWEKEVMNSTKPVVVVYYDPTDMKGTEEAGPVSYTHLDVYKRQHEERGSLCSLYSGNSGFLWS